MPIADIHIVLLSNILILEGLLIFHLNCFCCYSRYGLILISSKQFLDDPEDAMCNTVLDKGTLTAPHSVIFTVYSFVSSARCFLQLSLRIYQKIRWE